MIWFGSSAGVALSNMYRKRSRSTLVSQGWPIAAAYVVGFFVMLVILGCTPTRRIK